MKELLELQADEVIAQYDAHVASLTQELLVARAQNTKLIQKIEEITEQDAPIED